MQAFGEKSTRVQSPGGIDHARRSGGVLLVVSSNTRNLNSVPRCHRFLTVAPESQRDLMLNRAPP